MTTRYEDDEILQAIWKLREDGAALSAEALRRGGGLEGIPDLPAAIEALLDAGLLAREGEGASALSPSGEARARAVVRKHRLTERFFMDVLRYCGDRAERDACEIEHVISDDAIDHICTLLGHPSVCPDGRAIPDGRCCREFRRSVGPLVVPLTELEPGKSATVVYVESSGPKRLDAVASFGLLPGETIVLRQKRPSYIAMIGHTQLAFGRELAERIYVRPAS